ncbi:hypothetical protein AKJ48_01970 [candidate division MSBL1 archaeon SCGC-AAA261O19]|uniref:Uncharacterized protein n=2 Tax=candidate division MSBL1 TaxID=215777 RepID=A0A133V0C3_9EURY|nr:hypothetical protein AKJ42_02230 [candidate division MSBL1 archaeon SCGC-AAA261C02]KXB04630.1 hypothetical protein AKJ48_01970 [candidate division MSBL1 archaeon SCGC-AAA261O19]
MIMKGLISKLDIKKRVSILFIAVGFLVGLISGLGASAGLGAWEAFFLALFLFYVTSKLVPKVFDLEEEPLDSGTLSLFKLGLSSYWLVWLVSWVFFYNLVIWI